MSLGVDPSPVEPQMRPEAWMLDGNPVRDVEVADPAKPCPDS